MRWKSIHKNMSEPTYDAIRFQRSVVYLVDHFKQIDALRELVKKYDESSNYCSEMLKKLGKQHFDTSSKVLDSLDTSSKVLDSLDTSSIEKGPFLYLDKDKLVVLDELPKEEEKVKTGKA